MALEMAPEQVLEMLIDQAPVMVTKPDSRLKFRAANYLI
jgi:hypothetical protein